MNKKRIILSVSVLIAVTACVITLIYAVLPEVEYKPSEVITIGFPRDFPPRKVRFFPEHKFFVINDGTGIFAVSSLCTHLQCTVEWEEKEEKFTCDCHGSEFDDEGNVLNPPANKPLERYSIRFDEKLGLLVDKSVSTMDKKKWKEELFYYLPSRPSK